MHLIYSDYVYINGNPDVKYQLVPPKFSESYTITKIERPETDTSAYSITARKNTKGNPDLSRFTTHNTPFFKTGDQIYEFSFNTRMYATPVNHPNTTAANYFAAIYEINFPSPQHNIISDNVNTVQNGDSRNSAAQPWEIFPDNSLTGATGQLVFQMPENIAYAHLKAFEPGGTKMVASLFGNGKSKLIPGNYDLMLDKYSIKNVPIEAGKTTRLKIGRLNYSPRGSVRIVDANKQEFSMAGPFKIALPPGTYYIDGKKEHSFVIKDGEVTEY
jgi:hypothetical protein